MDELRRTKTYIHDIERCISFIILNVWKGNKKKRGVFKQGRGICPMRPHLTGAYA